LVKNASRSRGVKDSSDPESIRDSNPRILINNY
jgi:hypothetical protein